MKGIFAILLVVVACCAAFEAPLPASFTWQSKGVVGPVQDQGQCGSTLVFSIVDSISSAYAISTSSPYVPLSTLQVVNCSSEGCDGGDDEAVWQYIEKHGLYSSDWAGKCPSGKVSGGVCISGVASVQSGNETALAYALIQYGPIVVEIDGSSTEFEMYTSGIYAPKDCSTTELDTSLLVVGWTPDAWICQNS